MSPESHPERLSLEELEAEAGAVLPDKEVLSVPLLDLNADIDLALALAAPIDLAVAANANVVLPINASVSANVLSALSSAGAAATQGVLLDQHISGEAIAEGNQVSTIHQGDAAAPVDGTGVEAATTTAAAAPVAAVAAGEPAVASDAAQPVTDAAVPAAAETTDAAAATDAPAPTEAAAADIVPTEVAVDPIAIGDPLAADVGSALDGGLLNVDVNVHLDADLASPIAGAVAANANVAAPVDAAVAANIGTIGSEAVAVANQTAIITQTLEDVTAHATANQDADVDQ